MTRRTAGAGSRGTRWPPPSAADVSHDSVAEPALEAVRAAIAEPVPAVPERAIQVRELFAQASAFVADARMSVGSDLKKTLFEELPTGIDTVLQASA